MSTEVRRGTLLTFDATTWLAQVLLEGSDVEATIPVGQWVPAGQLVVDAYVAVLIFGDTSTLNGVVLGAYGAGAASAWNYPGLTALTTGQPLRATSATAAAFGALDLTNANAVTGALPLISGGTGLAAAALTTGQALRATGAAAVAFGAIDLTNANAISGALPVANGGLALTAAPANGQVPIGNATGYVLATLTGTANRVTVASGAGSITLNGPQDLHTAATPTFGALNLGAASGAATGAIRATANFETHPNAIYGSGYKLAFASANAKTVAADMSIIGLMSVEALASNPLLLAMSLVGAAASAGRYGYLQVSEYGTGTWHDLKLQPQGGNVLISGPVGFNGAAAQSPYASGGAAPAGGVGTAAGGWDTAAHRDAAITLLNNIRAALVADGIMS